MTCGLYTGAVNVWINETFFTYKIFLPYSKKNLQFTNQFTNTYYNLNTERLNVTCCITIFVIFIVFLEHVFKNHMYNITLNKTVNIVQFKKI